MSTNLNPPDSFVEERLEVAEKRIRELEAELASERDSSRLIEQRLAMKEREIRDIHGSRAWGLMAAIRSIKYRFVDPILGLAGLAWPPRREALSTVSPDDDRLLLQALNAGPRSRLYDVVCFSNSDWDSRFQRPQQLLSLFAAAGHRVFYVSQQFRREGGWRAVRKQHNVFEITLRGKPLNAFADRLDSSACEQLIEGLEDFRREVSVSEAAIIVHLPFWWPLAREARERFGWPLMYDCMDDHAGFSTVRRAMMSEEDALLSGADLVTVSSSLLEQRALERRSEVLLLRNGCDFEHFSKTPDADNARPVIGYYGAISDWFDSSLVAELAARRPDWDFLLVGSTFGADISRLVRLPNVSLPGEEPYESLPEWLGLFDVAIVPFKRTRLTEATNPLKFYEMLAGGRPIVSVPIPEAAMLEPMIRLASNAEEFERQIEASLVKDEGAVAGRRAFARENTWMRRFELFEAAIKKLLPRT